MIPLRASPRMYSREQQGSPKGPFLAAVPQGHWGNDAVSALPPLLHFPFGSPRGWVGAGRASPSEWGVRVCPPLRPCNSGWCCTRESPSQRGADPNLRIFAWRAPTRSWASREDPPWVCKGYPTAWGCCPALRCGAASGSGALEPRGGHRETGFSSGFDRCRGRKRFPLAIAGALTVKKARVCPEEEVKGRN